MTVSEASQRMTSSGGKREKRVFRQREPHEQGPGAQKTRAFLSTWDLKAGGGRKGLVVWGEREVVLKGSGRKSREAEEGSLGEVGWGVCTCACVRLGEGPEGRVPTMPGPLSCAHSILGGELVSEQGKAGSGRFGDLTKVHRLGRGRVRMVSTALKSAGSHSLFGTSWHL